MIANYVLARPVRTRKYIVHSRPGGPGVRPQCILFSVLTLPTQFSGSFVSDALL